MGSVMYSGLNGFPIRASSNVFCQCFYDIIAYLYLSGIENYALAQHSFIKSIGAEPNVSKISNTVLYLTPLV